MAPHVVLSLPKGNWTSIGPLSAKGLGLASQGYSVALSGAGTTLAVTAPYVDNLMGAVYVWKLLIDKWVLDTKLVAKTGKGVRVKLLGNFVGISWVGKTIVTEHARGPVVFKANKLGIWAQSALLTGKGGVGYGVGGRPVSVAVSGAGTTVASGTASDGVFGSPVGAVWVWQLVANKWVQQGGKLTGFSLGPGLGIPGAEQGAYVALDFAGTTLVAGSPTDNVARLKDYGGAVTIFRRNPVTGAWSQLGPKLVARCVQSLAISGDGQTIAAGQLNLKAKTYDSGKLKVRIWAVQAGGAWAQQGGDLSGPPTQQRRDILFGRSLALDFNGTSLVIGAPAAGQTSVVHTASTTYYQGASFLWGRNALTQKWGERAGPYVGDGDPAYLAGQGWSVSIDGAGRTIAAGGPTLGVPPMGLALLVKKGASWVFSFQEKVAGAP